MTQKELGLKLGFSEQTADVRIAQYESGSRAPRPELHKAISHALGVSFSYLQDHSVDSVTDIMYMLFDIDDAHGLSISLINGIPCLLVNAEISEPLLMWHDMMTKHENRRITDEEYLNWKYSFNDK